MQQTLSRNRRSFRTGKQRIFYWWPRRPRTKKNARKKYDRDHKTQTGNAKEENVRLFHILHNPDLEEPANYAWRGIRLLKPAVLTHRLFFLKFNAHGGIMC